MSRRDREIALYTGNDDNFVTDLTEFRLDHWKRSSFRGRPAWANGRCVRGGLSNCSRRCAIAGGVAARAHINFWRARLKWLMRTPCSSM
jgi:hypothetical protein